MTKIEVLLLPSQFLHFVKTFCTHCEAISLFFLEEK